MRSKIGLDNGDVRGSFRAEMKIFGPLEQGLGRAGCKATERISFRTSIDGRTPLGPFRSRVIANQILLVGR